MATLEDLSRMAMVEVDEGTEFPDSAAEQEGWGKMALMLAASAAVCGVVVGLQKTGQGQESR